jgi:NAD(P)-dependent dehydrogenase (short-subunit alcohol dehydrogenase family)
MDVSTKAGVEAGVAAFRKLGLPLHALINNAGVMGAPLTHTEDGFELQFGARAALARRARPAPPRRGPHADGGAATNYLCGTFYLTWLLLDLLRESVPSTVVNVSSGANQQCFPEGIRFDDLQSRGGYDARRAYAHSKLAQILHARVGGPSRSAARRGAQACAPPQELQRRLSERNVDVRAFSLHPGVVPSSGVTRHVLPAWLATRIPPLAIFKSPAQGAATSVFCAVRASAAGRPGALALTRRRARPQFDPRATPGEYHRWAPARAEPAPSYARAGRSDCAVGQIFMHAHSRDMAMAQRLWTTSEALLALPPLDL